MSVDQMLSTSLSTSPNTWSLRFPNPLHSVAAHTSNSKEILVSDNEATVFLVDWTTGTTGAAKGGKQVVAEFIDPPAMAAALMGSSTPWGGAMAWKSDDANVYVQR
jgi:hypothetical protein